MQSDNKSSLSTNNLNSYVLAEIEAGCYLSTLKKLVDDPRTFARLNADFNIFCEKRKRSMAHPATLARKLRSGDISTWSFLEKLNARKELDKYLSKTISYIYMRDLGIDLNQASARAKVDETVSSLIKSIDSYSSNQDKAPVNNPNSILQMYMNKKEFAPAHYWLMQRLASLKSKTDASANQDGFRKLVKIVAGVLVHHLVVCENANKKDADKLCEIVQLGYAYGLTYPFVDDLLDSNSFLTPADKVLFTDALQISLRTKKVPDYPPFENDSAQLKAIYDELKWAFEFLVNTLPAEQATTFFERANMFFEAQAIDRTRSLLQARHYTLPQILTTVVVKSAASRLISRDLVSTTTDQHFDQRTFCFGIYNQFNDDIKDIEEDISDDNLTPYTWFLALNKGSANAGIEGQQNSSIENPYHYYWAVVYYLVYELYQNNTAIKALFFERSMNALQSIYQTQINEKDERSFNMLYTQMLQTPNTAFNKAIYEQLSLPQQEVWFDKLISKEVSLWLKDKKQQSNSFRDEYKQYQNFVNKHLLLAPHEQFENGQLHQVANYCVGAGGKRIRAVMASALSAKQYNFNENQQIAVNQLLEYMHSASLIFDDLPSQDNANLRRGVKTAHIQYNSVAKAELGAVYLMMKAIEVQASIRCHPPQAVLDSIRYAAQVTQAVSEGQLLDIQSSSKCVNEAYLEKMCFFKTGLAIEAALVIPALLAQQNDLQIKQLKNLAKHMGMMFQIRDDLLDISGTETELGKPIGKDNEHSKVNFVTLLGEQQAIVNMLSHHNKALAILNDMPRIKDFFGELLNFVIYRTK